MKKIETKEDVINQLMHWLTEIGLGFHPDTPGNDYVTQDDTRLFTEEQASEYDLKIQQCFDVCSELGLDFYEMALDCFLPLLNQESGI
jgi:hypothetical protein